MRDLKEQVESKDFSFRGEIQEQIGIEEIAAIIEQNYHKTIADLRALKKRPVKEKKVAIYLLKRFSNLSNREIGKEFDISYSAVSKVVSSVEKQRQEDKQFREELGNIISHFKG